MDADKRIAELEEQLSTTKYNKATEHAFGVMKAQLAKLREKREKRAATKAGGKGFFVKRSGDGTVVLLGFPSVGKSSLLNALTSSKSAVAAFDFTTLDVIPGTLCHKHARIQILDVPGIVKGAASGRGRGKEVLAVVRNADLILMIIDALHPEHNEPLMCELDEVGVRPDQKQPDIRITKKTRGGIHVASTVPLSLSRQTIEAVLKEFRITNADIVVRSPLTIDGLIDALEGNKAYIPLVKVISKIDVVDPAAKEQLIRSIRPDLVVSAQTGENIDVLKELLFNKLGFVRVFLKEVSKKADLDEPLVVRRGATIRTVCERLHKDFAKKFRYARLWGPGARFPGQQVQTIDKMLQDGDILEIHLR